MSLKALVLCSDEKILRVIRRVLSDLEISVELCTNGDAAIQKLTRQRFEAVIVDCADEHMASQALRSARSAPCNKRAVAVAIIDAKTALRSAFELGAHFVLYKPISSERAKTSFRAARALMKRERRRNTRVPVEIPVTLIASEGGEKQAAVTTDLGEGGMAILSARRPAKTNSLKIQFTLPGTGQAIECQGQIAWENTSLQSGIRFVDVSPEAHDRLKAWVNRHSVDREQDDPPAHCKLTDLSLGGCYLEIGAPFPIRTRIIISMEAGKLQFQAEGVVRVMHPEVGMGVEFTQKTVPQREHLEKFIHALTHNQGVLPDLLVEPEGLDAGETPVAGPDPVELEDPLLDLFRKKADLATDAFMIELRRQRGSSPEAAEKALSV